MTRRVPNPGPGEVPFPGAGVIPIASPSRPASSSLAATGIAAGHRAVASGGVSSPSRADHLPRGAAGRLAAPATPAPGGASPRWSMPALVAVCVAGVVLALVAALIAVGLA